MRLGQSASVLMAGVHIRYTGLAGGMHVVNSCMINGIVEKKWLNYAADF